MENCLENVIKLSRTECECYEQGSQEEIDLTDGQTDLYLDELEGLNLATIKANEDCEEGNLWEMMNRSRENATKAFKADLLTCMQDNYVPARPNFKGYLGQVNFNQNLSLGAQKAGVVLQFNQIRGGKIKINRIGLAMSANAAVTIDIYDNAGNYVSSIATYTINSTANTLVWGQLSPALELPMWNDSVSNLEYYFVYTIGAFSPKNNKIQCIPCNGGAKKVIWANWVRLNGIHGTGSEYSNFIRTDKMNGLVLDVELICNAARAICSDEYPLDFDNNAKAMQIAYAIRYKAGALLLDDILSSPQINRFTMMDREALYGKRNHYRKMYDDAVIYICGNTPVIDNDCWVCKQPSLIRKGSILR